MAPDRPRCGARRGVLAVILVAGLWSLYALDIGPADVWPSGSSWRALWKFLGHAFSPALGYESQFVPEGAPPLLGKALAGAHLTVVLAAAGMSVAVVLALPLGFLASSVWWRIDGDGAGPLRRAAAPALYGAARTVIAMMRSVHELLWALLFLAAMGLTNLAAIVALAIPYAGFLAKVFSEVLDEAPRDSADALRAAGATRTQVFLFGLLPRALPDMASYAFYRFECALRSSAILGFFGPETLGRFIKDSWDEALYGEVWTYLYTLFALVLLMEWWSGVLRRRVVA